MILYLTKFTTGSFKNLNTCIFKSFQARVIPVPGRFSSENRKAMFLILTQFDAPASLGANGFHRLSMDLSKCKNSANIGMNMPQWSAGT